MEDLTGRKYGRWAVVAFVEYDRGWNQVWQCRCECGTEKKVIRSSLIRGLSTSCGCYNREVSRVTSRRHGRSRTPVQRAYYGMVARCTKPHDANYQHYGGRGISVCDRWLESFENFLADMGDPPPNTSLDRIDVNGNYCKENCRWATDEQQANNTRRNRPLTHNGRTQTLAQWARKVGLRYETLIARLRYGWTPEEALTVPVGKYTTRTR